MMKPETLPLRDSSAVSNASQPLTERFENSWPAASSYHKSESKKVREKEQGDGGMGKASDVTESQKNAPDLIGVLSQRKNGHAFGFAPALACASRV